MNEYWKHAPENIKDWPPKVRYDIAIPKEHRAKRKSVTRWEFLKTVRVGGSFDVPTRSMQNDAGHVADRFQMSLTARKIDGGVRIWRIR